jgi:hypothetical protein
MEPIPPAYATTRAVLHRVAVERVSPARAEVIGRIDLRATAGGFGTPVFDGDREVRVDGAQIVVVAAGQEIREPLEGVDEVAARWLGRFFALALHTLTELARDMPREWAPSAPKLWPEHFDYAIDAGLVRANYGFSPGGDEVSDEPYLYVGRWEPADIETIPAREAADPLAWLRERADALHAG